MKIIVDTLGSPSWPAAPYLEEEQLNTLEDEVGTNGVAGSQRWLLFSWGRPRASWGSNLLHQLIDGYVVYISLPGERKREKCNFKNPSLCITSKMMD